IRSPGTSAPTVRVSRPDRGGPDGPQSMTRGTSGTEPAVARSMRLSRFFGYRLGRGHQLLACPPAELQQAALFDVRPHRVLEFDVLAGAEREVGLELTQGLLGEFEDFVARGQGADEF